MEFKWTGDSELGKTQPFSCVSLLLSYDYHTHTSDTRHGGVFLIYLTGSCETSWVSYSLAQFDTVYLIKDSVPWDFPASNASHKEQVPRLPTSVQLGYRSDGPMTSSLDSVILPQQLTELRETFTCFTSLLKDVIRNTDEQRCIGWGLGRSWAQQLLTPWSWGMCHFPDIWMS